MPYQNTVQSTSKLYLADEIVYIASYSTSMTNDSLASLTGASWTNLGALAEFSREAKIEAVTPPSQNVLHETVINTMGETINLTVQELTQANYNKLMGGAGQSVTVAGTSTSATETYSTSALSTAAPKFVKFQNQNWSSTSATIPVTPASIVIYGSSTYVVGSTGDYIVTQNEDSEWGWLMNSTGNADLSTSIHVAYTYAPKAQSILYMGGADNLTPFMLKVYSVYSDGRMLTAYYPYVNYLSGGAIADKKLGEYKDIKFGLEAKEHPSFTYLSKRQFRIDIQSTS